MASNDVSEAQFIYMGLTKEKWPQLSVPLIQGFLDDPCSLDREEGNEDFVERFYHYFDWYHSN